jgi:glycosyltransferase involved in cell wall biosynthesis
LIKASKHATTQEEGLACHLSIDHAAPTPLHTLTINQQGFPLAPREPVVLSVGQFRPEKDHPLQIRAFARFLQLQQGQSQEGQGRGGGGGGAGGKRSKEGAKAVAPGDVKLVMLGSCRGPEDEARVAALRRLVAEEGIEVRGRGGGRVACLLACLLVPF